MQLCYNGLVRKTSSILLAMLGLRAFALSVPELPRTDYADTEVSTNVTLTALNPDDRLFSLVRVTVRGVSDPAERISFKVSSVGLEVRVR